MPIKQSQKCLWAAIWLPDDPQGVGSLIEKMHPLGHDKGETAKKKRKRHDSDASDTEVKPNVKAKEVGLFQFLSSYILWFLLAGHP